MITDKWTSGKRAGKVTFTMVGEPGSIFDFTAQLNGSAVKTQLQRKWNIAPTHEQVEREFSEDDFK